jgi:hypothetical protein
LSSLKPSEPNPTDPALARAAKKRRRRRNFLIYLGLELVVLIIVIWDDMARSWGY